MANFFFRALLLLSSLFLVMAARLPRHDSMQSSAEPAGQAVNIPIGHEIMNTTLKGRGTRPFFTPDSITFTCCPVAGWGWQSPATANAQALIKDLQTSPERCIYPADGDTGCQSCGCGHGVAAYVCDDQLSGVIENWQVGDVVQSILSNCNEGCGQALATKGLWVFNVVVKAIGNCDGTFGGSAPRGSVPFGTAW